jgi:hypothetical protein
LAPKQLELSRKSPDNKSGPDIKCMSRTMDPE